MQSLGLVIDARGARTGADQFVSATQRAEQGAQRLHNALDKAQHRMNVLGEAAHHLGAILAGGLSFIALERAIHASVHAMLEFEEALIRVNMSGKNSAAQMSALDSSITRMAATSEQTSTTLVNSFRKIDKFTQDWTKSLHIAEEAIDLAKVGSIDHAEASNIATTAMKQFNVEADKSGEVFDTLATLVNRSGKDLGTMSERARNAGVNFSEISNDVKDWAATMEFLEQKFGSSNNTFIRATQVLQTLANPTDEVKKSMRSMGIINTNEVNPSVVGVTQALENLRHANLSTTDSNRLFTNQLSGTANKMIGMADVLADMRNAYNDVEGANHRFAEALDTSVHDSIERATNAWKEYGRTIADNLKGPLKGFFDYLRDVGVSMLGYNDALLKDHHGHEIFGDSARAAAEAIKDLTVGILAFSAATIILQFVKLAASIDAITFSIRILQGLLISNPWGAAATAIGLAAAALYKFRNESVQIGETTATVGEVVVAVWEEVGLRISKIFSGIIDGFKLVVSGIRQDLAYLDSLLPKIGANSSAYSNFGGPMFKLTGGGLLGYLFPGSGQTATSQPAQSPTSTAAQLGYDPDSWTGAAKSWLDGFNKALSEQEEKYGLSMDFFDRIEERVKAAREAVRSATAGGENVFPPGQSPTEPTVTPSRITGNRYYGRLTSSQDLINEFNAQESYPKIQDAAVPSPLEDRLAAIIDENKRAQEQVPSNIAHAVGDGLVSALTGKFDPKAFADAMITALASGVIQTVFVAPLQAGLTALMLPITTVMTNIGTQIATSMFPALLSSGTGLSGAAINLNAAAIALVNAAGALTASAGANTGGSAGGGFLGGIFGGGAAAGSASSLGYAGNLGILGDTAGATGPGVLGAALGLKSKIPDIPAFARGGIVNGKTLAWVGEDGPEAIVPLRRYAMGGKILNRSSGFLGLGGDEGPSQPSFFETSIRNPFTQYMDSRGFSRLFNIFSPFNAPMMIRRIMGIPEHSREQQQYVDLRPLMHAAQGLPETSGRGGRGAAHSYRLPNAPLSPLGALFPNNSFLLGAIGNNMFGLFNTIMQSMLGHLPQQYGGIGRAFFGALPRFNLPTTFNPYAVPRYADGGIVTSPTLFRDSGRSMGLVGEAGPEAILPLDRGSDGRLGVRSPGSGRPVNVTINVQTSDAGSFRKSSRQIVKDLRSSISRF